MNWFIEKANVRMSLPKKFLFDTNLLAHEDGALEARRLTEADLARAQSQGFEAGRQVGQAEMRDQMLTGAAQLEAEALTRIAAEIGPLRAVHEQHLQTYHREAVALALSIGRKLAQALIARQPLADIEALVGDSLRRLVGEPRVVIRIDPALLDGLQARVDALAKRTGFTGQLILFGEDDLKPGECRIEWADGGAERDLDALHREIDRAIARLAELVDKAEPSAAHPNDPSNGDHRAPLNG